MPFFLKEKDNFPEVAGYKSVLIVPCRFCPAASLAVSRNESYIEFPQRLLKTASFEKLIETIKANFKKQGVRADVFKSNLLHQFVLCSWSAKKRYKLNEIANQYEALLVLGCEAAVQTIQDAIQPTSCQVVQGMETVGLMSIKPKFQLPCKISLELASITPTQKSNDTMLSVEMKNYIIATGLAEQTRDCMLSRYH